MDLAQDQIKYWFFVEGKTGVPAEKPLGVE